jgi:hypothetical protein
MINLKGSKITEIIDYMDNAHIPIGSSPCVPACAISCKRNSIVKGTIFIGVDIMNKNHVLRIPGCCIVSYKVANEK